MDLNAIREEITHGTILNQFGRIGAKMSPDFCDRAVHKYETDHIFHAEVDGFVAGVMEVIVKHSSSSEVNTAVKGE